MRKSGKVVTVAGDGCTYNDIHNAAFIPSRYRPSINVPVVAIVQTNSNDIAINGYLAGTGVMSLFYHDYGQPAASNTVEFNISYLLD